MKQSRLTNNNTEVGSPRFLSTLGKCCSGLILLLLMMSFQLGAIEVDKSDASTFCSSDLEELMNVEDALLPSEDETQGDYNIFVSSSARAAETELSQVTQGTLFSLNPSALSSLRSAAPQTFTLEVPMDHGTTMVLELYQVDIFSDNFFISSDVKEDYSQVDLGVHYRGTVSGSSNSIIGLSVFADQIRGMIVADNATYNLGAVSLGSSDYVIFDANDLTDAMKSQLEFECGMEDDDFAGYTDSELNYASRNAGDIVDIYIEVDKSIYDDQGSSVAGATAYATSLFNNSAAIYAAESITQNLSQVNVWSTADPYSGPGTGAYLSQFQAQYGAFNGDLAILVADDNVGGLAEGFVGLCNADPDESMCMSGQSGNNINNFPVYSYNTYIFAHELGHLHGSRHTHGCYWNGNSTQIDDCGNLNPITPGNIEGAACFNAGSTIIPASGAATVMSYCQTQLGGGYIAAAPFGPQPGNAIRAALAAATCLGPPPPPNDLIAGAAALACGSTLTIDISSATDTDGPVNTCGSDNNSPNPGVWYSFTGNGQEVTLTTCNAGSNFDTEISVFSGTPGSLTCVGNNDDDFSCGFSIRRSTFTFCSTVGETYYVYLFGFADQVGTAELSMSCEAIPHTGIAVVDCPADIFATTDVGCFANVSWTPPTATLIGGCAPGTPTVTSSHNPGELFPDGTTQVTYTFTYPGLVTQFCFFDIIVSDNDAPVFGTCPSNITVNNDPGMCGAVVGQADGYTWSVSDNCGVSSVGTIVGPAIGDVFPIGTTQVFVRAYDANQNEADCGFTVTVNDTEDPAVLNCPAPVELSFNLDCDDTNTPTLPNYTGLPQFTDNCGIVSVSQVPAIGSDLTGLTYAGGVYEDGATTIVTVTATDAAGNSVECDITVTLNDNIGPHIACPGDFIAYSEEDGDGACGFVIPDYTGLASAGVLCGTDAATVTQTPVAGTVIADANGVSTPITLIATDGAGNSEACVFNVEFCDNTAPTIDATIVGFVGDFAPANWTITEAGDGSVTIDAATLLIVSNDNGANGLENKATAICPINGSYAFDWDFIGEPDGPGALGPEYDPAFYVNGVLVQQLTDDDGPQAQSGSILVNCVAGDVIGFSVISTDGILGPGFLTITGFTVVGDGDCTSPAEVTTLPGECTASIVLTPPNAIDNCYDVLTIYGVRSDGEPNIVGPDYTADFSPCETQVTWYAEDGKGNVSEALCIVTVSVKEPIHPLSQPEAQCIGEILLGINDTGTVELCAEDIDNGSTDNCLDGPLTYQIHKSDAGGNTLPGEAIGDCVSYDCSDLETGPHYVCLIVSDCSGNSSSCITEVDLEEKHDPYIACPADIVIECDVDNDGFPLPLAIGDPNPSHLPDYPRANTAASSAATASPDDDFDAYLAWVAAGYGVGNPSPGQDVAAGITGLPIVYDNCGADITYTDEYFYYDGLNRVGPVSYISDLPINDPHECEHHNYEIERTWLVTDDYGRSASCMQLITVQDTTDPVIDPEDVVDATIPCDDPAALAALLAQTPSATDNCYLSTFDLIQDNSGAPELINAPLFGQADCVRERITREWLATDACGNTSNLIQIIDLTDTEAPELTVTVDGQDIVGPGPHNITVTTGTDPGLCNALVHFTASSTDNCSDIILDGYTFLEDGDDILDGLLNLTLTNGTVHFDRVLEKGVTVFYIGVLDDCANLSYVEVNVTVLDDEAPYFIDCTETGVFTFLTSTDDAPLPDGPDNCAGRIELDIPATNDNCPGGYMDMMVTINTGAIAAGPFLPYVNTWAVVNTPSNQIIGGLAVGTYTFSFRITDEAGLVSDICAYEVEVVDDENPTVECPVQTALPFIGTIEAATVYVSVSDDGTEDCTASYTDGLYGGAFGLLSNIVPTVADNCEYTATYTLTGAGADVPADNTGSFVYVPGHPLYPIFGPSKEATGMTFDLNVGNTSVLIQVTDNAGNSAQCSFSVTVYDDIDPTIICPLSIVATTGEDGDDPDDCTYTANVLPTVADNCAVHRVEYVMSGATAASGTILLADLATSELAAFDFEVGTTTVTYTVFDAQLLNSATCSFTVTVTDVELPVIGCPENTYVLGTSGTIYTDGFTGLSIALDSLTSSMIAPLGDCETAIDGLEITTTDNCCVSSIQYRIVNRADDAVFQDWIAVANDVMPADTDLTLDLSAQIFDKGEWRVELRAWDCHMNEGLCDFDVDVFDDEKPAFGSCPVAKTAYTVATSCQQTVTWNRPQDTGVNGVWDNCLEECGVDLIQGPFFDYDGGQNIDGLDPGIVVDPISLNTEAADFPVGTRYVKYYVDDEHGNREWCIFPVTVIDNINPTVAACSAGEELNFNLDCNDANTPVFPDYINAGAFDDNCSIVSITQSITAGSLLSDVFPTPFVDGASVSVTLIATDLGGNTATCTFNVTLNDNIGPSIACPAEQTLGSTLYGNGDCTFTLPDFRDMATAQVLCGNEEATVVQTPGASSVVSGSSVVVTLVATDGSGNSVACSFTVNLVDDSAPYLADGSICLDPAPVVTNPGECTALIALTPPSDLMLFDNCSAYADLTIIGIRDDSPEPLTLENLYTGTFSPCETEVTWYAIDEATNESEALCTVTVVVTEPDNQLNQPNAICLNIENLGLDDNGEAFICAEDLDGGISDCGEFTILIARADENGPILGNPETDCLTYTCADLGLQYVCVKVTDCSGNENFCTASFIVEDKQAPRIVCPANITIECDSDNDGDPLTYEGSLPPHALDYPAANTPVNIPTYNAWLTTPILTTQGQNAANGITGLPLAYDNCSAQVTYVNNYFYWNADGDRVAGEYDQLPMNDPHECARHHYDIERVWTVTDSQGYTAECTQLIQVRDTEAPVINPNGIADANLECSDAAGIAAWMNHFPTATDNCYLASMDLTYDNSGSPEDFGCIEVITRTWTATDACGNSSTLTQNIYLDDTTDPTLSVAVNGNDYTGTSNFLTVDTDPGLCSALLEFTLDADDNCDEDLFDGLGQFGSFTFMGVEYTFFDGVVLNGTATVQVQLQKGTNLVNFLVQDDCGNVTNVAIEVTVEDNEDPAFADCTEETFTFFTSQEDTPDNEVNGTDCYGRVDIAVPSFQDNCPLLMGEMSGSIEMSITLESGTSVPNGWALYPYTQGWVNVTADAGTVLQGGLPVGSHTVEFQMTDASGNTSAICSYTYDVLDDQDPILECPNNQVSFLSHDLTPDDCQYTYVDGIVEFSVPFPPFTASNSIIPVVYDNCEYTLDVELSGATIGSYTDVNVPADLDYSFNVGATSVLYTATDAAGNVSECLFIITVIDDVAPELTCPSFPDVLYADAGVCYTTQDLAPELIGDNCEGGYLSYILSGATALSGEIAVEDLPGALATINVNVGTTYANYTYYDAEGNPISCSFTIVVEDDQLPVVACPATAVVGTSGTLYATVGDVGSLDYDPAGDCESTVSDLMFSATDNCCINSVQYRIKDKESDIFLTGWIVQANEPLPADGDMSLDLSDISFEKGEYTIYFRAWDCSMNEGLCETDVTVIDDEKPTFTYCPVVEPSETLLNACTHQVVWITPTQDDIADNCLVECGIQTISAAIISTDATESETSGLVTGIPVVPGIASSAIFPIGTHYVKYYVDDARGNRAWCITEIIVEDNQAPTLVTCPAANYVINMDLNCNDVLTLGVYTNETLFIDPCGYTLSQSISVGDAFVDGTAVVDGQLISIDITATDASGNTTVCTMTLEIDDSATPNIDCPGSTTLNESDYPGIIDAATCMFIVPDLTGLGIASPSCVGGSVTITQDPLAGTAMPIPANPIIVTLTATDDSSLETNSCAFFVGYNDDVAPALVACAPTSASATLNDPLVCEAAISLALLAPTASDCSGVTVYGLMDDLAETRLDGPAYTADFPICTTVVTWYAEDGAGNVSEFTGCNTTVTVTEENSEDFEPQAVCNEGMVLNLGNNGVTVPLTAEHFGQDSFDNCEESDLTFEIHFWDVAASEPIGTPGPSLTFDCSHVGQQSICLIVTDCSGNSSACWSYITIQDKDDPAVVCPADITIACHLDNGGVPATGTAWDVITPYVQADIDSYNTMTGQDASSGITGFAQGWDNCGGTVTYSDVSTQGTDPTACSYYSYTVTRTWSIEDLHGNFGEDCVQIITVVDETNPYFVEGETDLDAAINCEDPNYDARMNIALALVPTPMDLCYVIMDPVPTTQIVEHDACIVDRTGHADVYEQHLRTWIASDACGNTAIYTQVISIQDNTAPAIACPLDGVPTTFYTNNGSSPDECNADVSLIAFVVDCQDVTVTYTVNDINNGMIVVYSGGGREFIADDVPPGDYCIHFYATDPCGNVSDCLYFFDVQDNTDPMLDCTGVADIAANTDLGICGAEVTFDHPILSDNCSGAELYVDYGLGAGVELAAGATGTETFPVGTTTVYYAATDSDGEYVLGLGCSFDVTVTDNEAPVYVNCPTEDVALNTGDDGFTFYFCGMTDSWKTPFVGDNCEVVSYTMQIGDDAPTATYGDESHQLLFPVGTTTIEYVATDAAGNSTICSVDVIVTDDEEPVTLCNDATIELDENGIAILDPALVGGDSYDNCEVFLAVSQGSFDCSELGEHTITMTASDAAGNSFWCTSTVTVEDNLAPVLSGCDDQTADAADGTCEYLVSGTDWDATATDNCSATLTNDFTGTASLDGAAFPTGETTVSWTATDGAGNTAQCSMTVTIGNPDLEAACQSYINTNTLSLGADGTLTLSAADFDGGSGSACDDLSFLISEDNGQNFYAALTFDCDDITLGTPINIVLEATDNATGDSDQCIAQLSITDGPILVEDCPGDVTVDANLDLCGAEVTLTLPETEGSCPVFAYSVDGGGFITTDSDLNAFFAIGTYEVQWAITNASGADAIVSGTPGNICSVTVTVNANGAILGCTDPAALNYNPSATCPDGSCVLPAACLTADELPYAEDFEEGLGLWYQEVVEDDFDWNVNSGPTESELTGPEGASSGDMYLYVESSYPNFPVKKATINSACLDLLEVEESSAQFAYNMNGEDVGSLALKVTVDGAIWETVWSQAGDQGAEWHAVEVDLSTYGDEMITLRFEGETGDNYYGDMAIDQFGLTVVPDPDPTCSGDITGDAVVDINDFIAFNSLFGTECIDCAEDLNNDGFIDINDFLILNTNYGNDCSGLVLGALNYEVSLVDDVRNHNEIVIEEQLLKVIEDMAALNFTIYPNPNEGLGINLFIDDVATMVTVSVKDMTGRTLSTEAFAGSAKGLTHYIDFTEKLSAGVYTVVVDTDGKVNAKRFVVE